MPKGQFSGPKVKVAYTSDSGATYNLTVDEELVSAGQSLPAQTAGQGQRRPTGFKPRGVHWQATAAGFEGDRKFLICGSADAALYATDSRTALTVDGVAGIVTGRRGEVQTF